MSSMKLVFYLLLILSVLKLSTGSDLITESCREASKGDPNIDINFCVSSLQGKFPNPPTSLDELVAMSIQTTKSKGVNIVSTISNLFKDPKFSNYAKKCLKDCSEEFSGSLSHLDEAIRAFQSKDFNTAKTMVSAAMVASDNCDEEFKEGKENCPLTDVGKVYFELTAISLAFINMHK